MKLIRDTWNDVSVIWRVSFGSDFKNKISGDT